MEDLTKKGKSMSYFDSATVSQIKEVVRNLVKMHTKCIIMDKDEWQGAILDNQLAFTEGVEQFSKFVEPFLKLTTGKHEETMRDLYKKYEKLFVSSEFIKYINSDSYKELNLYPVIVHGDLWGGNIMWKLNNYDDIIPEIAAFVDFQIMHEGSPMSDLARLMTICCDGSIRREIELDIFDYYYNLLTKELNKYNQSNPYTVELLKKSYDICFIGQALHTCVMAVFLKESLPKDEKYQKINQAKIDKVALRAVHAFHDLDEKLSDDYLYLFQRYGQ